MLFKERAMNVKATFYASTAREAYIQACGLRQYGLNKHANVKYR